MTKQQYLQLKQIDPMGILYEYYKERFDKFKHKPFLTRKEFDTFAPMCIDVNQTYTKVCQHYDSELNCIELRDKQGKTLMIY
jgi:hypothetical protein